MGDICEATQLSEEEELEVSQKSSLTRPFLDQRRDLFDLDFLDFFSEFHQILLTKTKKPLKSKGSPSASILVTKK